MKNILENYLNILNEEINSDNIRDKIILYFQENKNPNDDQIHKFAESLNLPPDELENQIYKLLSQLINLKGSDVPDNKFDKKQLEIGTNVEKEHIDIPLIVKAISKAHILENKNYYIFLKNMEKQFDEED